MIYDIIIAVLILLAAWKGWGKGAIRQIVSLGIIIAAALLASSLGTPIGKALGIGQKYLQPIFGFFILFAVLAIVGQFLARLIKPKVGVSAGLNNLMGAALSALKMIFLIGIVAAFLRMFGFPHEDNVKDNVLYPFTMKTSALIVSQIRDLVSNLEESDEYEEMGPTDDTTASPQND
jgi:uncharacterized membrane protein required for colicin V production